MWRNPGLDERRAHRRWEHYVRLGSSLRYRRADRSVTVASQVPSRAGDASPQNSVPLPSLAFERLDALSREDGSVLELCNLNYNKISPLIELRFDIHRNRRVYPARHFVSK